MAGVRARLGYAFQLAGFCASYVLVARLGLAMDAVSGFATLVWPPSGLALAGLLLLGPRLWPGIALGAFLVNLWMGAPAPVAVGIGIGNTLEAVVAAWLLKHVEFSSSIARLRDASAYVVVAAALATALGATIGTLSLFSGHIVVPARFGETWRAWWLGDAIGVLVVAPPLLAWGTGPWHRPRRRVLIEAVALWCALLLLSAGVFGSSAHSAGPFHQPYILVAVTIWAALRFGQRGTATTTFAMAGLAILATAYKLGPFAGHGLASSLSFLQVFVASVAVTGLFLAAAVSEREARANELARVNAELSNALKARDAFLSVASHELKTPLSALQLQTDVLLRVHRDMPESMAEKLHRINRQVDRLNKLVVQLLEVSRITRRPPRARARARRAECAGARRGFALRGAGAQREVRAARARARPRVRLVGSAAPRSGALESALERGQVRRGQADRDRGERGGPARAGARVRSRHGHRARGPGAHLRSLRARALAAQGRGFRSRAVDLASRSSTRWAARSRSRARPASDRRSRSSCRASRSSRRVMKPRAHRIRRAWRATS